MSLLHSLMPHFEKFDKHDILHFEMSVLQINCNNKNKKSQLLTIKLILHHLLHIYCITTNLHRTTSNGDLWKSSSSTTFHVSECFVPLTTFVSYTYWTQVLSLTPTVSTINSTIYTTIPTSVGHQPTLKYQQRAIRISWSSSTIKKTIREASQKLPSLHKTIDFTSL